MGPTSATAPETAAVETLSGDHPYVESGTLNGSALLVAHHRALVGSESYTVTDRTTGTDVDSGSVAVEDHLVLRVNRSQERSNGSWLVAQSRRAPDQPSDTYRNATAHCTHQSGTVECDERPFTTATYRQFGRDVLFLGTVRKLNRSTFEPDGTVIRDGQALYRYTATGLRSDRPAGGDGEYVTDAELVSATVLVTGAGYVYEFTETVAGDRDGDSGRLRVERTHRVTGMNGTTVEVPGWVGA